MRLTKWEVVNWKSKNIIKQKSINQLEPVPHCWRYNISFYWMKATEFAFTPKDHFQNAYKLLNLRVLKFRHLYKIHILQCMDKIFHVEFQRVSLKFHTKYLSHSSISPIHQNIRIWYNIEILTSLTFKTSYASLKYTQLISHLPIPWLLVSPWHQYTG